MNRMKERRVLDHESIFQLIHDEEWSEAATILHAHHYELDSDPILHRAAAVFVEALTPILNAPEPGVGLEFLEKLFLMHQGGFLRLPHGSFDRVVEHLVRGNESRADAAIAYARYAPDNAVCRSLLERLGDPVRRRHNHEQAPHIEVVSTQSGATDATRPLLRSSQEERFYDAVRDAFPTHLVYPNVALSAVLDFEVLESRLSREERRFFFRGLIDCVVFDHRSRLTPRFFFELDSPLHEDAERRKRDQLKDRILAAGGQHLYRIRALDKTPTREHFSQLIRETVVVLPTERA